MSATLPIIDVSGLATGGAGELERVARDIGAACRDIGFFYVANHSVPLSLLDDVFSVSARFFSQAGRGQAACALRCEEQSRLCPDEGRGARSEQAGDLKEAFNIGLELAADDPELLAGQMFRAPNLWPDMAGFRETMLRYFEACHGLRLALHRAFATDLGLAPDFFADKLDRPMAVLRLLHYPAAPAAVESGQLGAGEHTDYGCMTLLATDGVGGLEVQTRAGDWIAAPHVPGTFVCNIGDCLMRWTNDIYVSTPHRVVSPKGQERYSIAFFLDPNPEADIACLPGCESPERPARYAPIRGDEFLLSRLSPTYEKSGLAQARKSGS
jgi:isopenicillin N synthase-like dioxygenase